MSRAKKILELVIDRLSNKRAWVKGAWSGRRYDEPGLRYGASGHTTVDASCGITDPEANCFCVGGAILREMCNNDPDLKKLNQTTMRQTADYQEIQRVVVAAAREEAPDVYQFVRQIPEFNDASYTDHALVMKVLNRALEKLS